MFDEFITAVTPAFAELIGVVAVFFLWQAQRRFQEWTGVQIEEKHMAALHSAVRSGVTATLKHGASAGAQDFYLEVRAHVVASVPDALATLMPTDAVLRKIIARYRTEIEG